MKARHSSFLLLLVLLLPAAGAWAGERWRELPVDERREMRQQMREHWQRERGGTRSLESERQAPRRQDFSPDERQRLRDELRQQPGPRPPREYRHWRQD